MLRRKYIFKFHFVRRLCLQYSRYSVTILFDAKSLTARLAGRIEVGFLAEGNDTVTDTPVFPVVEGRGVVVGAVVPDGKRVLWSPCQPLPINEDRPPTYLLPLEADLQVVVELNEVEEMLQDGVRLVFRHANNALREVGVDEDGLPAGRGVDAHDGVDRLDGLPADR